MKPTDSDPFVTKDAFTQILLDSSTLTILLLAAQPNKEYFSCRTVISIQFLAPQMV